MGSVTVSLTPFQPENESVTEFLERFKVQNSQTLTAAENDGQKVSLLCRALPVNIITDIQRRLKPTPLSDATYAQIEQHLKAQFEIKKSVIGSSLKFINRKQQTGESIETYAKILNDLASQCEYKDCCRDRLIRDIFVSGLHSVKLIRLLLQEGETKSFNECVERAKTLDQLAADAADMKPDTKFVHCAVEVNATTSSAAIPAEVNATASAPAIPDNYICIRCGASSKHFAQNCFAINLECRKCHKKGHIAKVCKSKKKIHALSSRSSSFTDHEEAESCERCCHTPSKFQGVSSVSQNYSDISTDSFLL